MGSFKLNWCRDTFAVLAAASQAASEMMLSSTNNVSSRCRIAASLLLLVIVVYVHSAEALSLSQPDWRWVTSMSRTTAVSVCLVTSCKHTGLTRCASYAGASWDSADCCSKVCGIGTAPEPNHRRRQRHTEAQACPSPHMQVCALLLGLGTPLSYKNDSERFEKLWLGHAICFFAAT